LSIIPFGGFMKKFLAPAAIVLSIGLLSACNPLSLLGPIDAPDALGMAGQKMDSKVAYFDPAQQGLAAQGTIGKLAFLFTPRENKITQPKFTIDYSTLDSLTIDPPTIIPIKLYEDQPIPALKPFFFSAFSKTLTFDDPKDLPAIPDKLNAALKVASIEFAGDLCTMPATITAKYTGLSVEIKDAKNSATVSPSSTDGSITMTKRADGKYDMALNPDVSISANGMAGVLGNGTSPNSAVITMAIAYENAALFGAFGPASCISTITWGAGKGSYSF
jgi:hypothetical protein